MMTDEGIRPPGGWRVVALRRARGARMPSLREVAAVTLGAILVALLFVPHIVGGSFYNDGWQYLEEYRFAPKPGFFGAVQNFSGSAFRPGQMIYWPVKYALFGAHPAAHLAWSAAWAIVLSVALFVLLRQLGVARPHAAVVSILALIVPVSDANRLWSAADVGPFAIALFLIGANVSLQAFRRTGRSALALHAIGLSFCLGSVLTYEIAAVPMLLSIALYAWCAPLGPAVRRWAVDAVAVGATLLFVTSKTFYAHLPLTEQARHGAKVAKGGVGLVTPALLPFGSPPRWLGAFLAATVIVAAAVVAGSLPRNDARGVRLRTLLGGTAAAMALACVAWLMFVPSAEFAPLDPGEHNRVNGLAAIGLVAFAYSLALLAGELLAQWRGRDVLRVAVPAVACLAIGIGYAVKLEQDSAAWNRAADAQGRILRVVQRTVSQPPHDATIYTVGAPVYEQAGVPVFAATWDLQGALADRWSDASVHAYPMAAGSTYTCGATSMLMHSENDRYGEQKGMYGRTFVVDVPHARSVAVASAADCRSLARSTRSIRSAVVG